MCEFKIVKNDDQKNHIGEDIIILGYTQNNELLFKDVLGSGVKLDSALVLEVNTLNQTVIVLENPLIKDFLGLIKNITEKKATKKEVENFQAKLEVLKKAL